jgi:RNA polymerase sigma-70 factor (ECF subfamily)
MTGPGVDALVEHLFRKRAGQMVACLTRAFGPAHVDLAEEVVQEALVKALQHWPHHGVPDNPGAWLISVARNSALDALRRGAAFREREGAVLAEIQRANDAGLSEDALDRAFEDDELQMLLLCCDPSLSPDASVALALKTVGGFSVAEISHAFLAEPSAIAQRLVRAKRQLREAGVRFEMEAGGTDSKRLDATLEALYLMFNEGYTAHGGECLVRADVCLEALRLTRLLASNPRTASPRADALAALMAFHAARLPARVDDAGDLIVLGEQDRGKWARRLLAIGFEHLDRGARGDEMTVYHVQAAIAAVHARSAVVPGKQSDGADTAWLKILALYDQLCAMTPSPVAALNRAVAVARVDGPAAGLAAINAIETADALDNYYLLPAVQGQLWAELGDTARAADAFREALTKPCSEPERRFIQRKLDNI